MREDAAPASFGQILRRYRSVAGLTQEELARLSGLSVRAISDIERGRTSRPYGRTIRLLADALKLDEPARAQLMTAVYDDVEEAADDRQEWVAGWQQTATSATAVPDLIDTSAAAPAAPAPGRRDSRTRRPPRPAQWAPLAAATVIAALAGTVMGRAMVNHDQAAARPQPPALPGSVSSGASPALATVATCGQGAVDLASSLVHGSNGSFLGTVEVRYSYRCASAWTLFDPSPAVPNTKAVTVTLKLIRLPGQNYEVYRAFGANDGQSTNMLSLRNGCAQGSVILMKLGRELASATTPCQAPP